MYRMGLDIGSTTIKCVVTDENNKILFCDYKRHFSKIVESTTELFRRIAKEIYDGEMILAISGSAGMGLANDLGIPFVQEVYATKVSVSRLLPETDTVIELGGEDAKILFLKGGLEVRMNGTCAGGTGAFVDQMASLMNVTPDQMNELAKNHGKIYTIASRCGVFAKSDIQPLINQGAKKEDISASIFYAVVNQTIGGLAQGREIEGNILYLGGPLTFLSELRNAFDDVLKTKGTLPTNSLYFVALGASMSSAANTQNISELAEKTANYKSNGGYRICEPLFKDEAELKTFRERHEHDSDNILGITEPASKMYLGIDAGSTTVKAIVCDEDGKIFRTSYLSNNGNAVVMIKDFLTQLYEDYPDIKIVSSAVTGYGEDIIKSAFGLDYGIVETIAHYTAAKKFRPDIDFIIDIGGQDIKCFKIHNGAIDNIFLNEACSSGCGSFLQTFAGTLGYSINEFANIGLLADNPVDLGSRCTVFMNSSVKQAQKDGASVENISAGLSISVVKNALYKVIRCADPKSLGKNIVVQGGTFLNDAVLRAFEKETGCEVIRPSIAGLMGAYGAALYAIKKAKKHPEQVTKLITANKLKNFTHKVQAIVCKGCNNHCRLTVNTFQDGHKFIAGNRCEKPLKLPTATQKFNLFKVKQELLDKYRTNDIDENKSTIGIPMVLNMYELLPFWHTFFKELGFNVIVSPTSTHKLYTKGQLTIPSDTACYPAKLVHGHIEALIEDKVDAIFYPNMSYNIDEHKGDNHFNCPVVAYYPEVIKANVKALENTKFICDFVGLENRKYLLVRMAKILQKHFGTVYSKTLLKKAADSAYNEYEKHMTELRNKGAEFIEIAKEKQMPVIVLAGRPYHVDPEINHGIDDLICNLGAVVITEDSISHLEDKFETTVLNQWTYHSRLYAAAKYVTKQTDVEMDLVQLVSFGCGVDAVTTDETRSIIESTGKIYTQIKIDEITNTGAVKIRLRSLMSVIGDKQ